jgi:hypothetical protein
MADGADGMTKRDPATGRWVAGPARLGKRYQGPPCKRGHSGERYTCNSACVECMRQEHKTQRQYYNAYQAARLARRNADPNERQAYLARVRVYMARYRRSAKSQVTEANAKARLYNTLNILREEGWRI